MAPSYESSSYLYALDALTGTVLWKASPDPAFEPTDMAIANGTVYLVGASMYVPTIYAYNGKTGTQPWNSTISDVKTHDVVVANGVLYAISYALDSKVPTLLAIDASTGAFLARLAISGDGVKPAIANGFIYFGWGTQPHGGGVTAYHLASQ